ncbi:MAG: hypothetical protein P8J87_00170, partial [Verrucomicrobiales bacterium]|nr:hypothetical protein [Verrucomicrobiales bacterium]
TNLIAEAGHEERVEAMNTRLFDLLAETGGDTVPMRRERGRRFPWRNEAKAEAGEFPGRFFVEKDPGTKGR